MDYYYGSKNQNVGELVDLLLWLQESKCGELVDYIIWTGSKNQNVGELVDYIIWTIIMAPRIKMSVS